MAACDFRVIFGLPLCADSGCGLVYARQDPSAGMAMEAPERRRHKRFDMTSRDCRLALVSNTSAGLGIESCVLINLSYGGMCFRTAQVLQERDECQFLMDLKVPRECLALVRARICWMGPQGGQERMLGAEFLESTLGWVGPEENLRRPWGKRWKVG